MAEAREVRFAFGKNWMRFIRRLTPERIAIAEDSLRDMLGVADLTNKRFLDVGCGTGLFSLAARRPGATTRSFDYDADSVACAIELRRRYFPCDERWLIERGSALDDDYLRSLGAYDVVFAWGVLHHTGDMWRSLDLVMPRVAHGGRLFVAIYNDQGPKSRFWRAVKRGYNALPRVAQAPYAVAVMAPFELRLFFKALIASKPGQYWRTWTGYQSARGMDRWHDILDWVGGYPYEVATPPQVTAFCQRRGFRVDRLEATDGLGCNQFVLTRVA